MQQSSPQKTADSPFKIQSKTFDNPQQQQEKTGVTIDVRQNNETRKSGSFSSKTFDSSEKKNIQAANMNMKKTKENVILKELSVEEIKDLIIEMREVRLKRVLFLECQRDQ